MHLDGCDQRHLFARSAFLLTLSLRTLLGAALGSHGVFLVG
jgi:hypothetical protein